MKNLWVSFTRGIRIQSAMPASLLLAVLITLMPSAAQAIPLFSRQVGVPCSSCHAGGAFP